MEDEEDEDEDSTPRSTPKPKTGSPEAKRREHINVVFIGHVGKSRSMMWWDIFLVLTSSTRVGEMFHFSIALCGTIFIKGCGINLAVL